MGTLITTSIIILFGLREMKKRRKRVFARCGVASVAKPSIVHWCEQDTQQSFIFIHLVKFI